MVTVCFMNKLDFLSVTFAKGPDTDIEAHRGIIVGDLDMI